MGLGKSTVTLEVLAQIAQGMTVHYYAPTLELAEEIVAKARALALDAVLVRGREENKKDPVRWPALCRKDDVAADLGRVGRNIWESLCYKKDAFGNVSKCEFFDACPYVRQFDNLDGKLVVLAHEYLTLPKTLFANPTLAVVDERFYATLIRERSMPLERVTSHRPYCYGKVTADAVDALAADAGTAIRAVEAGKTMAAVGLTPERLRRMARTEEALAEPPAIWPGMPYAEQQRCAKRLQEIEAFGLARLWRVLAEDNDRVTQRVVVARGIEWKGELQDRIFIHKATEPKIPQRLPVLLLDADHDPLIGAATLPTNRRTVLRPRLNAEIVQVCDTACSKNKLMTSPARRAEIIALARHETAQGRRVLIGTYKSVADLLRAELADPNISIAHFGAIRGLDMFFDTKRGDNSSPCGALTYKSDRDKLQLLSRYELTLERSLFRALYELQRLQNERRQRPMPRLVSPRLAPPPPHATGQLGAARFLELDLGQEAAEPGIGEGVQAFLGLAP